MINTPRGPSALLKVEAEVEAVTARQPDDFKDGYTLETLEEEEEDDDDDEEEEEEEEEEPTGVNTSKQGMSALAIAQKIAREKAREISANIPAPLAGAAASGDGMEVRA